MWVLSQVSQVRLFPMVEKGSVVHRATIPGPTTDPPLTLVSFLMFTTAIWSIPDLGLTLITVGRRSLDPSFLVTEALPKRTLVPMAGFGWLLSKTAFCNCISFNQFTGYCYVNQWRGCLVVDGYNSLIIRISSASFLLFLLDSHCSHPIWGLEVLDFQVCPRFLGKEQLGVHLQVSHFSVKVHKW